MNEYFVKDSDTLEEYQNEMIIETLLESQMYLEEQGLPFGEREKELFDRLCKARLCLQERNLA